MDNIPKVLPGYQIIPEWSVTDIISISKSQTTWPFSKVTGFFESSEKNEDEIWRDFVHLLMQSRVGQ